MYKKIKKCWDNGITIYPIPTEEMYFVGKKKRPYVRIEINANGKKKQGTELYKQEEQLTNKIHQLYGLLSEKI